MIAEEQDLEIVGDTDVGHGFLVSQLTDHISEMADGSLVILDCPVARTGFQEYAIRDLPREAAKALGIDVSNPSATIDLYRPASEVFAPEFLASLNGRPITDGHPPGFVTPQNFSQYAMGHVQNPREAPEPLADGELAIIADLVISGEPLVSKVRNKTVRDISLGYDFAIDRDGDRIIQCSMLANHNAVVPQGRAGDLISIGDEAPKILNPPPEIAPPAVEVRAATLQTSTATLTHKKENKPVANILKHIMGLGFKAYATDADPEKVAEAAEAIKDAAEEPDMAPEQQTIADKRKARDRRAKDEEEDEPEGGEVTMTQDRKRMHDRLDEMLDGMGKGRAKDADISALRDLINDYLAEEEEEPEHMEDADPSELEEALGAGEEPDAEDAEACPCGEPGCPGCEAGAADIEADPGEKLEPSGEEEPVEDRKRAADAARTRPRAMATDAARNSVKAALRMIRPHVARVGDENLSNAFNVALRTVAKPSRASSGGYGAFAGAAAARNARTPKAPVNFARAADAVAVAAKGENEKTQKLYDTLKKGGTK